MKARKIILAGVAALAVILLSVPGGMRTSSFIHNGMNAYYWTSTLFNTNSGYFVTLSYDDALVQEDNRWGSSGLSVRCIKD